MTVNTGVRVVTDNVQSVLAAIKRATRLTVLIGIPADKAPRPGDAVTNAMIGHINEFGSPTMNIPARPHLVPGVLAVRAKVTDILKTALINEIAYQQPEALDKGMHAAGLTAVASVKNTIEARLTPKLADYTISKRLLKGRTGDKPLIDSSEYINSITYVIRPSGGTRDAVA